MKHIKPYQIFENSQELQHPGFSNSEEEIHKICKKYKISNYTINDDLSIDVEGGVRLASDSLRYLPLKFNYVSGIFNCSDNYLETLKGAPHNVGGDFECQRNELTSLEDGPHTIGGTFVCSFNNLKSLEGAPHTVGGGFECHRNKLTTLKGSPHTVGGDFYCHSNGIKSLKGGPKKVGGYFNSSDNKLTSLEYLPKGIDYNSEITSFYNNPIYTIVNTFIRKHNINYLLQEFNHYQITDGKVVYKERLEMFCGDFELKMPNLDKVKKHYKIV